ncbi:MAG: bifunctional precorrin-2 dehydrogenase/sirohydrochlorin ferrochelatase [Candidatus Poribacteria bacterium]|nr:bifunctional precorrin-2 dehydrogenase/sirohydrochlorin ferrochelatase [Candidatus Poribacteria bacterium]
MFYPAHLNLQNRQCLVVGAGIVAERKVFSLLRSGGDVTLISPEATQPIEDLAKQGSLRWRQCQFQAGDTEGMFLVCAATDHPEINTRIFKEAHETYGINLVNVVDVIPECTFAAASVITHGDFTISISTSGKSPAMSRRIREHLEAKFGAASLYEKKIAGNFGPPPQNQGLPYPVYFLLENRRCVVMSGSESMSETLAQRLELLHRCGASVERIASTADNLDCLSDAFLVIIDEPEFNPGTILAQIPNQIQLVEFINTLVRGTFITPLLVMDGDLIISISTNDIQSSSKPEEGQDGISHLQTELACQFENNGYGEFIDFLGSLRPLAMKMIPTQAGRQQFFDDLIDQVPGSDCQTCCLSFENRDCSTRCTFNLIRNGRIEHARQWATERICETA